MIFVLAVLELAAFPPGFVIVATKALAVSRTITKLAWRPRVRWILAIAENPGRAAGDPAVVAASRLDVPCGRVGARTIGTFREQLF
jgi:hypothetical protein